MRTSRLLSVLLPLGLTLAVASAAAQQIEINEIRIDHTGADTDEYFELRGPSGTSLTGLTYIVIGDAGTANTCGVIESVTDLSTFSIQADGLLCLVSNAATPVLSGYDGAVTLVFENSDNVTHMLVRGFSGTLGDDLDTNDDGVLDATPWTEVVDCVGLSEGTTPDCAGEEYLYCATVVGPDGAYVPGQVYRCSDTGAWVIGQFSPLGATDTPGAANPSCASPPPDFTDEARQPCVPQVGGPVAITARVRFADGAYLTYQVNGGPAIVLSMSASATSGDTTDFETTIPGTGSNGDRVEYLVKAYNDNPDTTVGFAQGYFAGTVQIGDLRVNDANGANVYRYYGARIRGNVTVPIGVFSLTDTDYYVQDATGGINVFQFGPHIEQVTLGDDVTIEGALDQYNGKLEIAPAGPCATLEVFIHGSGSPPAPQPVLTCEIDEAHEGMLVQVFGVSLDDDGDLTLVGDKNYGIFRPQTCNGDTVIMRIEGDTGVPGMTITYPFLSATGIVNQYDYSAPYDFYYELMPRYRSDLAFQDPTTGVWDGNGSGLALAPPAPNPFTRRAIVRYRVPGGTGSGAVPVTLAVYDPGGRRVATLVDAAQAPGEHHAVVDAGDFGGPHVGIFFVRLEVAGTFVTRKVVFVE